MGLKDTLVEASDEDKRCEWQKIEADFNSLKGKKVHLIGLDHTQDHTAINQKYIDDVESVFL